MQARVGLAFQLFGHIAHAAFVVPRVAHDSRTFAQRLPASGEVCTFQHLPKAVGYVLFRYGKSRFAQLVDGSQRGALVFRLVDALERTVGQCVCGHRLVGENDWRANLGGACGEYGRGFGLRFAYHHRREGLDDARFFGGYFFERVAQNVGVVEADVGDDRQCRRNDVGAVAPSAKPYFHDGHVHLPFREVGERQRGRYLEKRRLHLVDERLVLAHEIDYALFRYHVAVDADAFAEVAQVRRRVEPDPIARALQHRGQ